MSTQTRIEIKPPLEALTAVLGDAPLALAAGGEAEQACRLAARAYVALRRERPDEARRINALIHGLTRSTPPIKEKTMPTTDPDRPLLHSRCGYASAYGTDRPAAHRTPWTRRGRARHQRPRAAGTSPR